MWRMVREGTDSGFSEAIHLSYLHLILLNITHGIFQQKHYSSLPMMFNLLSRTFELFCLVVLSLILLLTLQCQQHWTIYCSHKLSHFLVFVPFFLLLLTEELPHSCKLSISFGILLILQV